MEDRDVTGDVAGGLLVGVFDGHGGDAVAEHAATHALDAVAAALGSGLAGPARWRAVFTRLDLARPYCGATATLLLARAGALDCAWVGDSRALLVHADAARVLAVDHRIGRDDERRRVVGAGAALDPPYAMDPHTGHGLMVTRALGDHALRRIGITAEPEVVTVPLGPAVVGFVVATDGLWDVVGETEAAAACREVAPQAAAERLVNLVVRREGLDNVTVVVGRL
jgi:serine/threonine protein phosphatase PrpC